MPKPGGCHSSGISLGDVLRLPKRHPAWRRREAQSGSCTERENLAGDAKGKGASGSNREAESTDAPERGGLPCSSDEAGVMLVERRGRSPTLGASQLATGGAPILDGRRQPSFGGTSRMTRECHVRICERLGVKLPGPTRHRTVCSGSPRAPFPESRRPGELSLIFHHTAHTCSPPRVSMLPSPTDRVLSCV